MNLMKNMGKDDFFIFVHSTIMDTPFISSIQKGYFNGGNNFRDFPYLKRFNKKVDSPRNPLSLLYCS